MQPKFRRGAARKEKAVKEQLANMTIIELVKKSHEVASQPLDYYVTPVVITELASRLEALNLVYIGAMNNLRSATSTIERMGVEGAYLLNGAAAELNGSWVRHKTVLGAQAALLCISQGDICAAREWLEGTVDEVGADMPDDMTVAGLQAWFDSQMVAVDGRSGFLTRREAEDAIRARIPATDAWQRELRQTARAEGINYAAGRLAAAFNHGFVDKPMAEVGDVVRMILTTKDDLANDSAPAADGLSGEYAEKALEDWEQQLRAGIAPQKPTLSQAITDIIAERQRQKEKKGYTESRDDNYLPGVLNLAGAAYAVSASYLPNSKRRADRLWPWPDAGKYLNASSKDPRSALIKAAALITAEIERIDRAQLRAGEANLD